jgi:hypothetical protein
MPILTKPSFAPSTAIIYVTVGALLDVWTAVYYFTFVGETSPADRSMTMFWLSGFFLTGVMLMVIGLVMGPIGRSARQAEMPPTEVTPQAVQAENAAQRPVVVPPAATTPVQTPVVQAPVREVVRR